MQLLVFCLTLKKPPLSFFYFSNKSATDTHGNAEFLTSSLVSDPSGGAFTRPLSAKHYAIANGLCRRQEAGAAGPVKAQQQPPPPPPFFPESICVHAWTPVLSPCRHTHVDKHTFRTHGLSPPPCCFSLALSTLLPSHHIFSPAWSRCCLPLPQCLGLGWEQWHYISFSGSWKKYIRI